MVVAAGGVYDGRGVAAALIMGAVGLWVGTMRRRGVVRGRRRRVVGAGRGGYGEDVGGYWEAVVGEEEWVYRERVGRGEGRREGSWWRTG